MKSLTRRGLLSALPAFGVAATATAQEQPAVEHPTREQDFTAAKTILQNNAAALSKVKIPTSIEPAFQFKA